MTEPREPHAHPYASLDPDDGRDTVTAGAVDDYPAKVNAPLRPETTAEIDRRMASGDVPRRKVRRRAAAEQPVRHTADTITSDALDRLYARVDYLAGYAATLETYAAEQREFAEQAEAAIAHVRALADEWGRVGRDPNACIDMSDAADALLAALAESNQQKEK